jgi:hypothetical protein
MEKNVISDTPDPEETYIGTRKKEEQELFRIAHKILEEQNQRLIALEEKQKANPPCDYTAEREAVYELNEDTETIVSQATRIAITRASHIFDTTIASLYHLNDPASKTIFYMRFFWFLSEMKDWLHHIRMENEIMGEPSFFDLCEGEKDKKLQPCYDSWRDWLSDESFSKWFKARYITSSKTEFIEEETKEGYIENEEEDIEEMDIEHRAIERNAKYFKEKCPTCKDQCAWYKKKL